MARAGELGADPALTFLREVDSINMRRRTRMVELTTKACGGTLLGANIAVLGAAFKPESDDVRDSPALNVAGMLQLNGAAVNVYDPKAMDNSRRVFPTLNYSTSVIEACDRADAVLVLTVDEATLARRLEGRPGDEFGAQPEERALVMRIHASGEGLPPGIPVDATAPLPDVVDAILDLLALPRSRG